MASQKQPIVWTIGGSDSGGGAGIQADLATFRDFGVHGCSVISAVTAQNSFAVGHIAVSSRRSVAAQINALDSDLPANAIKIGMLGSRDVVEAVAKYLSDYEGFIVCDPVVRASSGHSLLRADAADAFKSLVVPACDLLTPNRFEAEGLSGRDIESPEDVESAAEDILELGAGAVLITGGHLAEVNNQRWDYFSDGEHRFWLHGPNIDTVNTHGSGCTLSSAIAACMAKGMELDDTLVLAKSYVTQGLRYAMQIGGGPGAVFHGGWPQQMHDYPGISQAVTKLQPGPFPSCGKALGLYPVVDTADWVEKLVELGITTIQLRNKTLEGDALAAEIKRAVDICQAADVRLFINDHWSLAIKVGAYGVHLGQEDLLTADLEAIRAAGLRLGVSTHSISEISRAHAVRPSYIALGPIFATSSKVMAALPQGTETLRRWVALLRHNYTLTAIGGISVDRARNVLATGVASCAVISAITEAPDYIAATKKLLELHGD